MRWFEFIYDVYDLNKVNKFLSKNEREKRIGSEIVAAEYCESLNSSSSL